MMTHAQHIQVYNLMRQHVRAVISNLKLINNIKNRSNLMIFKLFEIL